MPHTGSTSANRLSEPVCARIAPDPGRAPSSSIFVSIVPARTYAGLDWRVSTRRGRPYVRAYHDELSADWQLCLDRSASMRTPDDAKWTLAVQLTAAFAYLLLHAGNRIGLVQFSSRVDSLYPLGRGRGQYVRIADQLRQSEAGRSGGESVLSSTATVLQPGTHLVILSDFLAPDAMQADLERLSSPGRKIHAVQVLSPNETALGEPATRFVEDVESGEQVAVGPAASDAARAELKRWQRDLAAFSVHNGIRLSSCSATDRWQDVMLRHIGSAANA